MAPTRRIATLSLLALTLIGAGLLLYRPASEPTASADAQAPLKNSELFYALRNFPWFEEAADGFRQALDAWSAQQVLRGEAPFGFDTPWENLGPRNIGGRVNTVARHPSQPGTLLAGMVAGGIFKTVDNGATWYPVFDGQPVMSIAKIVYDPLDPNVVYATTGDPNISSYVFLGRGVYKSTDGGESWSLLGLQDAGIISALAIHPQNSFLMLAGSMGVALRPGDERGLYLSFDGGGSWTKTLSLSDEAGITDILIDPQDPDIVYACGWHRVRNQAVSTVNGPLSRVYRSKNGGLTWEKLEGNGLPGGDLSRSGLAWSQGSVFVQFVGPDQNLEGIYRSDDQGDTWTPVPLNGLPGEVLGGFGWYFCKLRVNPQDKDDIFLLGVDLWRTRDGGQSWEAACPPWWTYEVHADKHDLLFTPEGHLVLATDGGMYRSEDDAATWARIDDLPNTQFYRIALNPHEPGLISGGAQDNGTMSGYAADQPWPRIFGGDGFQSSWHPQFPELFYAETQFGGLVMSPNGGVDWDDFTFGIDPADNIGWDVPWFISTHEPHPMYYGTNRVYRNDDPLMSAWSPISGKLTDPIEPWHPRTHTISAMGESPLVSGLVLAGTGDGYLWMQGPTTFGFVDRSAGLPQRYVTSCQGSPENPDRLFVTHSGYRFNSFLPHVHRSDDLGATWKSIDGDLPPFAVNDLVIIPGRGDSILFVATDGGVFGTVDGGTHWHPLGSGMPVIPVYDIAWEPTQQVLVAGTHARSMFTISLAQILEPQVSTRNPLQAANWQVAPNPVEGRVLRLEARGEAPEVEARLLSPTGTVSGGWRIAAGERRVALPVGNLPAGVYLLELRNGDFRRVLRVLLP